MTPARCAVAAGLAHAGRLMIEAEPTVTTALVPIGADLRVVVEA